MPGDGRHLAAGESAGQSGSTPASQLTGRHHAHHPPDPRQTHFVLHRSLASQEYQA